jgi:hypothetical protein
MTVTQKLVDERKAKTSLEIEVRRMMDCVNEVKMVHSLSEDSHDKIQRELDFISKGFEEQEVSLKNSLRAKVRYEIEMDQLRFSVESSEKELLDTKTCLKNQIDKL